MKQKTAMQQLKEYCQELSAMKSKEEILDKHSLHYGETFNASERAIVLASEAVLAMQEYADQETAKLKKEYEFEINKLQSEIHSLQSALDNIAERGNY